LSHIDSEAGDAAASRYGMRKVRASLSRIPPNGRAEQSDGQCNRKYTARLRKQRGKGETVV
jgi:hypothetical protein